MAQKNQKKIRIKVLMSNQLEVIGIVTMPSDSYYSRLSDLINNNQNFLILTDVEVYKDSLLINKTPFLCINKQTILFLSEESEKESTEEEKLK